MRGAIVALSSAMVVAVVSPRARAFTREKTDDGIPVYWTTSCVTATVYLNGFTMMTPDEVAKSIGAAAHAWSPSMVSCAGADGGFSHPYFEIVPGMAAPGAATPAVSPDGRNVIIFRNDNWEYAGQAVALTSLTKKRDGRILDADMEIDAEFDTWANLDPNSPALTPSNGQNIPFDLQNAVTHEFGHFIGLDHTCQGLADPVQLIDNNGQPVPECDFAPADVQATTMFATIDPAAAEVSKRVLSQDDIDAVCDVYPAERDPHACVLDLPDDGCGCAAGGDGGSREAGLAGLGLLAALRWGRARRAGRGPRARRA